MINAIDDTSQRNRQLLAAALPEAYVALVHTPAGPAYCQFGLQAVPETWTVARPTSPLYGRGELADGFGYPVYEPLYLGLSVGGVAQQVVTDRQTAAALAAALNLGLAALASSVQPEFAT